MEPDTAKPTQPTWQWDLLVGILPVLALMPLLIYQSASLWSRDHMHFFPLVLLAVGLWVMFSLRQPAEARDPLRVWSAISLLIVGALFYVYAVWQHSPWFAHLALLLVFAAWALPRFGQYHWARVMGWTALLATTLPWPWGWDQGFSNWLQTSGAWCTARALDALSIPCLQNGSSIETRDLHLIADEICGGLASVYAFGAFAILLGLITHSSFIVGFKTLLLVPVWTLIGHFARLFGILTIQEYLHRDLSNGWDYRLLEIATAGLVMLLIWAANRLLTQIYQPIPVADAEFGPIFSGLNKLFCWPQPDPFDELAPSDDYERQRFLASRAERQAKEAQRAEFLWSKVPAALWAVRLVPVVLLLAAVLPLRTLASQGLGSLNFGRPSVTLAEVEAIGGPESLPENLDGGWKRVGFRATQRNPRSRKGEFSLLWAYQSSEGDFTVSLDLPFLGWNDPIEELKLRGWKSGEVEIRGLDDWPWGECELENELGGRETLFYSLITRAGQPYTRVPSQLLTDQDSASEHSSAEAAQPEAVATAEAVEQSATAVTYQFQLLSESGDELSQAQREALRTQFLQLRHAARALIE